jgi:hypothetical protein
MQTLLLENLVLIRVFRACPEQSEGFIRVQYINCQVQKKYMALAFPGVSLW